MPDVFSYRVTSLQSIGESVSQIFLQPLQVPALTYQAGQYIEVMHENGDWSPLSIACAPNSLNRLEFHLFHTEQNQTANDLLRMARQEKKWRITGPRGDCTVARLQPEKPVIFLARGTGFAPVKAVMEALLQSSRVTTIHFYWSVKTSSDLYLLDVLKNWEKNSNGFTFIPVLTQETGSHVLPDVILRAHPDLTSYQVYASGPQPLINTAFSDFVQHGLPRANFYSDLVSDAT